MTADPADFLADRLAEDDGRVETLIDLMRSVPQLLPPSLSDELEVAWSPRTGEGDLLLQLRPGGVEVCFREDPRRLEHDLRARALIASDHSQTAAGTCATCADAADGCLRPVAYPCPTLRRLTWVYAEHLEFEAAWLET